MFQHRPKQLKAAEKLINLKKAILCEDCGIGKTMTALIACKKLNLKTYIVTPASNKSSWIKDAKILGFTNYEVVSWAKLKDNNWVGKGVFVVDEAHRCTKWSSLRTQAVYWFSRKNDYIFLLTATPSQHRPLDFYWLLKLCKVFTQSKDIFRLTFCGAYQRNIGRKRILVDGVPTRIPELKALFDKVKIKEYDRKIDFNFKHIILNTPNKSKPEFNEIALFRKENGEEKLKEFKRLTTQKSGAIFFTYHRSITKELAEFLGCPFIVGGQSTKERNLAIDEGVKKKTLVISIKAGGEAINGLDAFNTCYFLELTYSPLIDRQAILRMVRDENDATLYVNYFVSKDEHTYVVNNGKKIYLGGVYGDSI